MAELSSAVERVCPSCSYQTSSMSVGVRGAARERTECPDCGVELQVISE
jgi:predicted RNA-binding Zn-ribbon protein involved in translation (DUF1610 family)